MKLPNLELPAEVRVCLCLMLCLMSVAQMLDMQNLGYVLQCRSPVLQGNASCLTSKCVLHAFADN